MEKQFLFHARTLTGLEPVLAQELQDLGVSQIEVKERVVFFKGTLRHLYVANLWCRTAIRILLPVAAGMVRDEKELYQKIRSVDWSQWMEPEGTLAVDANVFSSFTTHSLFVAQLVKDAVVDQFRQKKSTRPSVDLKDPDLRIAVHLFQNQLQLFVDASGESLHRRGYRTESGKAPLSEVLAAGLVLLSNWDKTSPIVDPMCGSGTIVIEAGLIARNIAPGTLRKSFGFQKWKNYDPKLFGETVREAKQKINRQAVPPIMGSDNDARVVEVASQNVRRAGLSGAIQVKASDFFEMSAPYPKGTLVCNPPYDKRISTDDISDFYYRLGEQLKKSYSGWNAFILAGQLEAIKSIRLRTSFRHIVYNSNIECRFLKYELR